MADAGGRNWVIYIVLAIVVAIIAVVLFIVVGFMLQAKSFVDSIGAVFDFFGAFLTGAFSVAGSVLSQAGQGVVDFFKGLLGGGNGGNGFTGGAAIHVYTFKKYQGETRYHTVGGITFSASGPTSFTGKSCSLRSKILPGTYTVRLTDPDWDHIPAQSVVLTDGRRTDVTFRLVI